MLSFLSLLSVLALGVAARPSVIDKDLTARWATTDQYGGKVITPTNYSVVTGVFVQDEPTFNATGYNLLNDSFGLLDKSPSRWTNFTK